MSDCPYCEWTDACGCSWMHTLPHVEEEHPEKGAHFRANYYNPEFNPCAMGREQEERHARVFAIVRELAGMAPYYYDEDAMGHVCSYCATVIHYEGDHQKDCLWLRAQKFRQDPLTDAMEDGRDA